MDIKRKVLQWFFFQVHCIFRAPSHALSTFFQAGENWVGSPKMAQIRRRLKVAKARCVWSHLESGFGVGMSTHWEPRQVDFSKEVFQEHQDACDLAGSWIFSSFWKHHIAHCHRLLWKNAYVGCQQDGTPRWWGCWRLALIFNPKVPSFLHSIALRRYQENQRPTAAAALEHPWFQEGEKRIFHLPDLLCFHAFLMVRRVSWNILKLHRSMWFVWGSCCQSFRIPKLLRRWFLMFRTEMLKDVEIWNQQKEKKNQPSPWYWNLRHIFWSILDVLGGTASRLVSGADWWWNRGWWGVDATACRHKDVPCIVFCSNFVRQSEPTCDKAYCDGCQKRLQGLHQGQENLVYAPWNLLSPNTTFSEGNLLLATLFSCNSCKFPSEGEVAWWPVLEKHQKTLRNTAWRARKRPRSEKRNAFSEVANGKGTIWYVYHGISRFTIISGYYAMI